MKNVYDIVPVAKPRQTSSDKWKQRPAVMKYRAFKDECRLNKVELPDTGAHITFIIPFPKSYSLKKRRKMDGQPHIQVPDVDNLCKALMDAVFGDDSGVYDIRISKYWGYTGKIVIDFS